MIFVHMCMFIYIYMYVHTYIYIYICLYTRLCRLYCFNDIYVVFYLPKRMTNLAFEGAEASEEDLQVAEGEAKAEP